jgi:hypothetical protein
MLRIDRDTTAWKIQAELQHLKRALLEEVNSVEVNSMKIT